jgi:serine/threonine protein phosphatase PrpC
VFVAYGVTDKGRVRPINEDCFAIDEALGLCVIADGMGGHNAGEVAARLAVDAVVDVVKEWSADAIHPFGPDPALSDEGNLLRTAILLANAQILEQATTAEDYAGMGTTVVVTRVTDGRLAVAHVGDSRLYLFDGQTLRQVTRDDSWVATVLATDPTADPLLLQHHPMRNALTNVVGARPGTEVHVIEEALAGGEVLLLTTDGVHGVLDDERLERLMREEDHPRELAERVISAALARGSRDNCTAIVARYT